MGFFDALAERFGERARRQVPLAPFTTFRVGGPAEWFFEPGSAREVTAALAMAHAWGVPVTLLGGGSNVLVSDLGLGGLVLRPRHREIAGGPSGEVRADAGVTVNALVRWTIVRGLAGLEAWAGTPGTIGGGVYGNAHYGGRLLGEHILSVGIASRQGEERVVPASDMAFGYDRSRLQQSGEVLLWARFRVSPGEPAALRQTARASLAHRKRTQPLHLPSAGCVFQNPLPEDPWPEGVPRSAGAVIDRVGLKGLKIGGARISPLHANFFVNEGEATAADVKALIDRCRRDVRAACGVVLREEIVCLGEFRS
jgi:UDP-N-acetylmuramate dehydrogenase